ADLLKLPGECQRRGDDVVGGLPAAHGLEEAHDVRRAEEVQPDDVLWPRGRRCDFVNVQGGGVGRQHGAFFAYGIQAREYFLLDCHVLEHGLDDQVDLLQLREVAHGPKTLHRCLHLFPVNLPARDATLEQLLYSCDAAAEACFILVEQTHAEPRRQAGLGYGAAHPTRADDGDARVIPHRRLLADTGHPGTCALCKERVSQALGLRRVLALLEKTTFGRRGSVEVEFGREFDCTYYLLRRYEPSRLLRDALARRREYGIPRRLHRQATDPPRRTPGKHGGKCDCLRQQVILRHRIDEARLQRSAGVYGIAGKHHVQRPF